MKVNIKCLNLLFQIELRLLELDGAFQVNESETPPAFTDSI